MRYLRCVIALVSASFAACAFDPEGAEPGEDPEGSGEAESSESTDVSELATATCNTVTNWASAAVPSANGNVNCNMVRGTNSPAVAQLQRSMNVCYLRPAGRTLLVVDGDFGGNTRSALIFVQGQAGTAPDGEYGPNTRKAMRHESNEVPNTCVHVP
jgi:peptidoglycan hydrolase-like protein with peptidoglycan-binding domain